MLAVAEAGSLCLLGMKSSNTRRWRGWWWCRSESHRWQQKCWAEGGGRRCSGVGYSVPKRDLLDLPQWSLFFMGNSVKDCWQRHIRCVHILSRTKVKLRELLSRLEKCGVCFFFLLKNGRLVAVELLHLCKKRLGWKEGNRLFCVRQIFLSVQVWGE